MTFSVDDIRKQEFAAIDANKDGKVSLDEYRAQPDRDADARLRDTGRKQRQVAERRTSMRRSSLRRCLKSTCTAVLTRHEPPQDRDPRDQGSFAEAIRAAFTRLDANKDGKLSLQEYLPKA